jgi:diguanylate cyclase (GGDEF)-like protein
MSIRTRVVVVVAVCALAAWVLLVVSTGYFGLTGAEQLERVAVGETLAQVTAGLSADAEQLGATANDWARWDDSFRFVSGADPGFVASNLDPKALQNINVDAMVFTDDKGRVVYEEAVDRASGGRASAAAEIIALATRDSTGAAGSPVRSTTGLLATSSGLMLVATRPILKSSGAGPAAGALTIATRMAGPEVAALSKTTGVPIDLFSVKAGRGPADVATARMELPKSAAGYLSASRGSGSVSGYRFLEGVDGRPAAILRVTEPRSTMNYVAGSLGANALAMLVIVTVMLAALGKVLDLTVLRRFSKLNRQVREIGDSSEGARVTISGKDEVAALAGEVNCMLGVIEDSRRELVFQASHDPLTGLANRRRFEEELTRELAESRRLGTSGSVLWLDLDDFKDINDGLGHLVGDELLVRFGALLESGTRAYSSRARLGGDEFAILLPHADEREARATANRIRESLALPVEVSGPRVTMSASIGIALYPRDGSSLEEIMAYADIAMYDAKQRGSGLVTVYSRARYPAHGGEEPSGTEPCGEEPIRRPKRDPGSEAA